MQSAPFFFILGQIIFVRNVDASVCNKKQQFCITDE